MIKSAELENGSEHRRDDAAWGFEECEKGELCCVYGYADDRGRDTRDLTGYNYKVSHCARIPRIGVRDIPVYKRLVPALVMVGLPWTLSCGNPCIRVLWVPTAIKYPRLLNGRRH